MASWQADIYRGEWAQLVKKEYRSLLEVKKSDEEAERMIIEYCMQKIRPGSINEARMWLALALREWEFGRLSDLVKQKALSYLSAPVDHVDAGSCRILEATLNSPMPERKKIRLPSWVKRCPYKVGSLLAYRIISSTAMESSFYWKKYVLLRVIKIDRSPVTYLAPEAGWNESMLVGLYDWWGDEIPDPAIAESLEFTPIEISGPSLPKIAFNFVDRTVLDKHMCDLLDGMIKNVTSPRVETCCDLSWTCSPGISKKEVFTYLGCDERFQEGVSDFFKTKITEYSLSHSIPFDATLVRRFTQLYGDPPVK